MGNADVMDRSAEALRVAARSHKSAREFHRKRNIECMAALATLEVEAKAQGIELTKKAKGD